MHDRGLRRSFPAGVERAAKEAVERVEDHDPARGGAGATSARWRRSRSTRRRPRTSTTRSPREALARRPLARVGAHRRRQRLRAAGLGDRPRGLPARDVGLRAGRGRADAARGAVQRRVLAVPGVERLAVTVELDLHGADVVAHVVLPLADPQRRAAGLRPRRPDLRGRGARATSPGPQPLAAARAASAALRARREAAGALAVECVEPEFAFDRARPRERRPGSEQTESHQLIEHLMIAANEAVARLLSERDVPALYRIHERPEPAARRAAAGAVGVARRADAAGAGEHRAGRGRRHHRRGVAAGRRRDPPPRRAGGLGLTSLVLRSLKQAKYSPENKGHAGLHSTAYCHFTSPIRRYPDLVCHRALLERRRRRGGGAARVDARRGRRVDLRPRARRDADRARRRRRRPRVPAGARAVRGQDRRASTTARSSAWSAPAPSSPSATASRASCPPAACAATGGSSTRSARSSPARTPATPSRSPTPSASSSAGSTRRAGGPSWTSLGCPRADRYWRIVRVWFAVPPDDVSESHARTSRRCRSWRPRLSLVAATGM